jgi:transposase-like protein
MPAKRFALDKIKLSELYWEKGYSIRDIATLVNCGRTTVDYWMKKFDIPHRSQTEALQLTKVKEKISLASSKPRASRRIPPREELQRKYTEEKLSWGELTNLYNVSPAGLFKWFKQYKLKKRTRHEAQKLAHLKYPQAYAMAARKISLKAKNRLSNPESVKALMKKLGIRPNKSEEKLATLLDNNFPGEWRYVGNGEVIIGGKCPDFINVNGKKKLIELFGAPWHDIFDVARRVEHFKQFGFDTLIIWTEELKDESRLKSKIIKFCKRRQSNV